MAARINSIARESLFLRSLPDESVDTILGYATNRQFDQGQTVFLQGDPADTIYIVIKGWVKLYRVAPNGSEAIVGVFTAGHSFGEALALRHEVYPVAAEAVTDSHVLCLPTRVLTQMIESDPQIALSMLAATFQHLHSIVLQLEQIKALTGAQRVAEFLVELCPVKEGACTVTLPYDKVLIAGRLGMKPESLSRAVGKLRGAGVTIRKNHAAVADVEFLQGYASGDEGLRLRKSV